MSYRLQNKSERLVSLNYRMVEAGRLTAGRIKLTPGAKVEITDTQYKAIENVKLFLAMNADDLILVEELDADVAVEEPEAPEDEDEDILD